MLLRSFNREPIWLMPPTIGELIRNFVGIYLHPLAWNFGIAKRLFLTLRAGQGLTAFLSGTLWIVARLSAT